ncbi:glucokinase [Roseateles koreensis]|uniref:Glucokinase n=1 Tax=Roseateles koreensis TaxID=2987526 RepID=A0ABT5KSY4_9BURK|nr:glucokinase [Roseateles koreensis]MDC8786047.1 glucokinase [Roseateles koreensis]
MSAGYPCLVADIGGTNARFGWVTAPGSPVQHVAVLPVRDHVGPAAAVTSYLAHLAQRGDWGGLSGAHPFVPRSAAFAVATAVEGDHVMLTNSHWSFSQQQLRRDLGLDLLLVLNDFEALALSLPRLNLAQLRFWEGSQVSDAVTSQRGMCTLAVIGPGTGLGVAGVTRIDRTWAALPSEGGHATVAPADDFESEILNEARRQFPHVSAERLLSGIGLPVLHAAVAAVKKQPTAGLSSEMIVARGLSGEDSICAQTLDTFCALLGSFAGNVALIMGARAGVYIGGGIVPRLGERFFSSQFRERFEAKGRFRSYLAPIPTALVTDTLAALTGAALAIEQHRA